MAQKLFVLSDREMPRQWYNITPDMPNPVQPPLHPGTGKPIGPDDLAPIFPMGLIQQEVSEERWIDIPEEVLEIYRIWRPTPLVRANRLESALGTPAKIYYKWEGVSPPGSHKPNTAVAQAYYNKREGTRRLTTETGAGQWGSALSFACNCFDLECKVYMVRVSYEQKPYRRSMMEVWGANVVPSPSEDTQAGREIRAENPDTTGSLGIAISEAVEDAASREDTKYSLGSVLHHVCLHQTIVGLECKKQLALLGDYPDIVIGCCGGGSNFSGMSFPFAADKASGREVRLIAVEPTACPTLTRGLFAYDFGDTARLTPLLVMYTLGHKFVPPGIHAGGLRYHGAAPTLCQLIKDGIIEARAYDQVEVFASSVLFARAEGHIPAPESAHAIKAVTDEAKRCADEGKEKTIVFNLSGHGHFDMSAYDAFVSGKLQDYPLPEEDIRAALHELEHLPRPK